MRTSLRPVPPSTDAAPHTWGDAQRRRMAIFMDLREGVPPKEIAARYGVDVHTVYNVRAYGLLPRACRLWSDNGTVYCDDGSGEIVTWRSTHNQVLARYAR